MPSGFGGPLGNAEHVRFQLEQVELVQIESAFDSWREKKAHNPAGALAAISTAAGLATALGRAWYGMGDEALSAQFHARAHEFQQRADELVALLERL